MVVVNLSQNMGIVDTFLSSDRDFIHGKIFIFLEAMTVIQNII